MSVSTPPQLTQIYIFALFYHRAKGYRQRQKERVNLRRNRFLKQSVALVLSLCMVFSTFGGMAFAEEEESSLCPHHAEHTAECEYEGTGQCNHICEICAQHGEEETEEEIPRDEPLESDETGPNSQPITPENEDLTPGGGWNELF